MNELQHKIWVDSINFIIQDGLSIEKAIAKASAKSNVGPFPIVNGQQTEESKALQANKALHKPEQFNPNTCEDALL